MNQSPRKSSILILGLLCGGLLLAGCGKVNRIIAHTVGYATVCVDGVEYLQFPSGASVKYGPDGKIVLCPNEKR